MNKFEEIEVKKLGNVSQDEKKSIFDLYKSVDWWKEEDINYIEDINIIVKNSYCFIAVFQNKKIIGCGRAICDGISDAYIQDIVVNKDFRNKGIGAKIIKAIIKHLKENNIYWIGLIAQPGTKDFYKRLGFSNMKDHVPMCMESFDGI